MNPGGLNNSGIAATALQPDDVRLLTEIALLQNTIDVTREIERLEALRVAMVAEIDERAVSFDTLGFRSVKMWLAANSLLEVSTAGRILALGRMLGRQPEIADAYNVGDISAEHAALIGKFCETPPRGMPNEALDSCRKVLLDSATGPTATTTTVRTCISRLERIFESDELPPSEDSERNEFHASKTLNGRVAVKGDLDAVTGEMLLTALSSLTKPRNPMDDPAGARTPARQRADAFAEILRRYLDSGDAPIEGGERPHLSLHVNASDLARSEADHDWAGSDGDPDLFGDKDIAHMPHTGPLSIAAARRLACDCHLTPIVMSDGVPLNLGRTSRTVSKKQRRALVARDHGCAFPGCGAPPAHCEGHHVIHWADGGATDLDNLVLLCRYHHTLLHHSHWRVKIGTDRHPPPSTSCRGYPQVHPTIHRGPLQETRPRPQSRGTTSRMTLQPAPETWVPAKAGWPSGQPQIPHTRGAPRRPGMPKLPTVDRTGRTETSTKRARSTIAWRANATGTAPPQPQSEQLMNRFSSAAILLYVIAVVAQALTWADLDSAERSSRVVLFLLAAALLTAILGSRADRG